MEWIMRCCTSPPVRSWQRFSTQLQWAQWYKRSIKRTGIRFRATTRYRTPAIVVRLNMFCKTNLLIWQLPNSFASFRKPVYSKRKELAPHSFLATKGIDIELNDTPTLMGRFVSSPREREQRDGRYIRGDEKEGQGRKRNRNESEETGANSFLLG